MANWWDDKLDEQDEERGTGIWRFMSSDHVVAIRWDRKEQEDARQQIEERLNKMAGIATRNIQESHSYGDLSVAYISRKGAPDVYKYYNVPYQTYYYMWKGTPSVGHYVFYYLTRQHLRGDNKPASYRAACPYRYENVGKFTMTG